jgi:DNA-binding transcriptional LysR family regulator
LNELNAAEEELQKSDQGTAGLIRVDSATPFVLHVIAPLMHKFRECYPDIEIELNSNDQVIDLLHIKPMSHFDLGNLMILVCMPSWYVRAVYILWQVLTISLKGTPTQPEELEQHDLIGFTRPTYINSWPIKVGDEYFLPNQKLKHRVGDRTPTDD